MEKGSDWLAFHNEVSLFTLDVWCGLALLLSDFYRVTGASV